VSEHITSPSAHQSIWTSFSNSEYRHAYNEAHNGDFLASQINSLRVSHGWSQTELAKRIETSQPMICKWETSCEGVRMDSLQKLAAAFDVALLVKFVPFSVLAKEALEARADKAIPSFDDEAPEAIGYSTVRIHPPEPRSRNRDRGKSYLRVNDSVSDIWRVQA
jgi:transcriptional regulator with XRE-family HTH domain